MKKVRSLLPGLAGLALVPLAHAFPFADGIVSYQPGSGAPSGFNDPSAALGPPSRVSDDPVFGVSAVDPFSPPYLGGQLVSIGAGGSLTLRFDTPISNNSSHAFGIDFILFGNTGFDTGPAYNGIANGNLFGNNAEGSTRISVSADNLHFFLLDPSRSGVADGLFPTDGGGDPLLPVDPSMAQARFESRDLSGIRTLYAGSAGGTGYDLGWAIDDRNQSVSLEAVRYVRIEVLAGHSEIDAVSVVPEPSPGALGILGLGLACSILRRARGRGKR